MQHYLGTLKLIWSLSYPGQEATTAKWALYICIVWPVLLYFAVNYMLLPFRFVITVTLNIIRGIFRLYKQTGLFEDFTIQTPSVPAIIARNDPIPEPVIAHSSNNTSNEDEGGVAQSI